VALPQVHVITPGDHYSPRTGSAIPTVVHGLAAAGNARGLTTRVAVACGTYPDRYDSAEICEYNEVLAGRHDRRIDAVTGRLGLGRPRTRRRYAAALVDQADWEPSVVLVHNAPQAVGAVDASRHVPVLYAHNELLRTYSRTEAGRALENAAHIVCVSEFLADRTRGRLPPSLRERVVVVRNGVDTTFFHPTEDLEPQPGGVVAIVYVGRVLHDKGADVLVRAVALLDDPAVRVTVVGAAGFSATAPLSTYEQELRRVAAPLGDRVTWSPFRPRAEVAAVLRGADVAVVPSRWPDPCPLTVLEAMASGVATVASRTGGIPEIAGDGVILVPPDDPEALAAELSVLVTDATLRTDLGRRARASVRDWAAARSDLDAHLSATTAPQTSPG
jgi:glycosyltransferase involved in cell wall biosynthesis